MVDAEGVSGSGTSIPSVAVVSEQAPANAPEMSIAAAKRRRIRSFDTGLFFLGYFVNGGPDQPAEQRNPGA